MEYINGLDDESGECFLCRYRDNPAADTEHLVLSRSDDALVVMNRFPYTGGHLLVAPPEHAANLSELPDRRLGALMAAVRDWQAVLTDVLSPDGFNVGVNLGRCAGAGLPGHLHLHLVPRWDGDTNFMSVLGDVRVIPQALEALYSQLLDAGRRMGVVSPPS